MRSVSGLVLAGGSGRRMGQPKAFIEVAGQPLVRRAVEAMSGLADDIYVATGPLVDARRWLDAIGPRALPVPDPGQGPMSGVRAGVAAAAGEWTLVAPCDAPLVSRELFELLLQRAKGHDAAIPRVARHAQPLLACYRTAALARAAALCGLPRELPRLLKVAWLDEAALEGLPHGVRAVQDADTPEELARLLGH